MFSLKYYTLFCQYCPSFIKCKATGELIRDNIVYYFLYYIHVYTLNRLLNNSVRLLNSGMYFQNFFWNPRLASSLHASPHPSYLILDHIHHHNTIITMPPEPWLNRSLHEVCAWTIVITMHDPTFMESCKQFDGKYWMKNKIISTWSIGRKQDLHPRLNYAIQKIGLVTMWMIL